MNFLVASTPGPGHLTPLLSIASLSVESGHEVAVQVNERLCPAVEAAGHRCRSKILLRFERWEPLRGS
jgi:UDP:flavonoid glycosyltransferase YjiC (YdhE family)